MGLVADTPPDNTTPNLNTIHAPGSAGGAGGMTGRSEDPGRALFGSRPTLIWALVLLRGLGG